MSKLTKMILIILILFLSNTSFSSDFTYGLKIGGTYSTADSHRFNEGMEEGVSGDTISHTNNDYYWGTFFSFYGFRNIYKIVEFQFELNLNQKGLKYDNSKETFQLIEVVTLLKLNLKYIKPYIGVFSSSTLYEKFTSENHESDKRIAINSIDYGSVLGVEFRHLNYLLDFRYSCGFGDIYDNTAKEYWSYNDNSRQFVLSLGYEF